MFLVPSTLKRSESTTDSEQYKNNGETVYTAKSTKVEAKLIETENSKVGLMCWIGYQTYIVIWG